MDGRGRERPDDEEDPGKYIYWRPDFINHDEGESGVDMSVQTIFRHAADLVREQDLVNDQQLSLEYMRYQKTWDEMIEQGLAKRPEDLPKSSEVILSELDEESRRVIHESENKAREALKVASGTRCGRARGVAAPQPASSRARTRTGARARARVSAPVGRR